ncbi:MAG: hypothetical protein Kow0092_07130 [Deferrisomatales bacterium]
MPEASEEPLGGFAFVRERIAADNPAWTLLGIRLSRLTQGRAILSLPFRPELCNPHGAVHGGLITALLDAAGGCALYTALPPGARVATVELKVNFLRPLRGDARGEGEVVRAGSRLGVSSVRALGPEGDPCAVGLITYVVEGAPR